MQEVRKSAVFTPSSFVIKDLECPDGVTLGLPDLDRLGILDDLTLGVPDSEDLGGVEVDLATAFGTFWCPKKPRG